MFKSTMLYAVRRQKVQKLVDYGFKIVHTNCKPRGAAGERCPFQGPLIQNAQYAGDHATNAGKYAGCRAYDHEARRTCTPGAGVPSLNHPALRRTLAAAPCNCHCGVIILPTTVHTGSACQAALRSRLLYVLRSTSRHQANMGVGGAEAPAGAIPGLWLGLPGS